MKCPKTKGCDRPVVEGRRHCEYHITLNREAMRRYMKAHPQRYLNHVKDYARRNPERIRRISLKSKYGITPEEFAAILASQGGRCGICRTDKPTGKHLQWNLDHDHITGFIRGILCDRCNMGLGQLGDSIQNLLAAIEYLKRTRQITMFPLRPMAQNHR